MIGQTISHFHVLEKLGGGGMGVVYLAEDIRLKRKVALKFLPPHLSTDADARQRFEQEAEAASALNHPNVCTIYEIGDAEDGQTFIAMAHYEGETLKAKLERGPLPTDEAVDIARQVAEGLAAAHEKGIIHRDIKPANIFITTRDRAVILDFGLAKLTGALDLTKSGSTLGTAYYMSPEQLRGERVDHRTDVWSLGVVLHEMLSGRRPFVGEYDQAISYAILNQDPPPLPSQSALLESIVREMLRKDRKERTESAVKLTGRLKAKRSEPAPIESAKRKPARTRWILAGGGVVAVAMLAMWLWPKPVTTTSEAPRITLVVLPFENIGSPEYEFMGRGIAEDIASRMMSVRDIELRATRSAVDLVNEGRSFSEIGGELNVDFVLDGSVQATASRVRLSPKLIRVVDAVQVWGDTFDGDSRDALEFQSRVATAVAENLGVTLGLTERRALEGATTSSDEAYRFYLKGRHFWNKRNREGLEQSVDLFRQAIDKDPTYAHAWAGLGDAYLMLGSWGMMPSAEVYPLARASIEKSLDLNPDLAEAHTAMAYTLKDYYWEWDAAEEHFLRAIELEPTNANAHHQYGLEFLSVMGRHDDALQEAKLAASLDPLSLIIASDLGRAHYMAGQYEEAIDRLQSVLAMDSSFFPAMLFLGIAQTRAGNSDEAVRTLRRAVELSSDSLGPNPNSLAYLVAALADANRDTEAHEILRELVALSDRRHVMSYWLGMAYGAVGDLDQAFTYLDRSYAERDPVLIYLKEHPEMARLRTDPRAVEILARMGLP